MLLSDQSDIDGITPMPTDRVDDTSVVLAVTSETLTWFYVSAGAWASATGQGAGTIVYGKTVYDGILNSSKSTLGGNADSSVSFGAATRVSQRISVPAGVFAKVERMTPTNQKAEMTKYLTTAGDYAVDHRRGRVWANMKATVADDSITYSVKANTSGGTTGDKVDLIKVGGTAVTAAAALADNTALPTSPTWGATPMLYDGATLDMARGGSTANSTTVTGFQNQLPMARYNATPTARTEAQFGNLQQDANGNLLVNVSGGSTGMTDDSAFSIGVSSVTPAGFLFDDTATDSVDEGDVGLGRMSGDRKQIIAGAYLDDVVVTPAGANTYAVAMGAIADETTPDSVDEGDFAMLRATLTRFLKISQGDLQAGEDLSNNVQQVVISPLAISTYAPDIDVSAAAEASSVSKASTGVLYGFTFSNANASTRYLQFYNSTTVPADTAVPFATFECPSGKTISGEWPKGRYCATGIAWANSSTQNTKTIGSADSLCDVQFK